MELENLFARISIQNGGFGVKLQLREAKWWQKNCWHHPTLSTTI